MVLVRQWNKLKIFLSMIKITSKPKAQLNDSLAQLSGCLEHQFLKQPWQLLTFLVSSKWKSVLKLWTFKTTTWQVKHPILLWEKNLGKTKIRWNKNLLNNFQKGGSHTLPYLSAFWNDFGNIVFFNSLSINTVRLNFTTIP